MLTISSKGNSMPASPIRKLVPYAQAAKAKGKTVYHLNIGQPDIKTPEHVMDEIRKIDLDVIEYSNSEGIDSYRDGLANYYQNLGLNIRKDNVMITTGGSEALLFGFMTCLNYGDEIIIPEPYYANYNGFVTASGASVKTVTATIENGFALPPINQIEKSITDKTKAILICNPGNPTGYLYTKEELTALKDLVIKHDLYLFADEVYREFCYDGNVHTSVLEFDELKNHVIMVDSVSKRYSMCGARIGAFITRNEKVFNTAMKFAQARLSPPTLGQIAGEAALSTPQSYFDEVIEEYVERRNVMVNGLNNIDGVFCPMPSGAFYAVASLPIEDAEDFCMWMLNDFIHNNQTVMLAPANGFYSDPSKGRNQVRVAYVLNIESLKKALDCIRIGLEEYKNLKS